MSDSKAPGSGTDLPEDGGIRRRGRPRGRRADPAEPMDRHLGLQIRKRRMLLGLTQTQLGREIGVTFQQVQKYERGTNRISASRLAQLARVLQVPMSFFFDGAPGTAGADGAARGDQVERDLLERGETAELVRAFYRIRDEAVRSQMLRLLRALAESVDPAT